MKLKKLQNEGFKLAFKDNVAAIKEELNSQEKWIESLIKSERFFKKHKNKIFSMSILLVALLIGYFVIENINKNNLYKSNEAYRVLLVTPDDAKSLEILKSKNKPLYRLFSFHEAIKNNNNDVLQALIEENKDDFIADLAAYQLGKKDNVKLLDSFILLEEGFALLKDGKTEEASVKFSIISPYSAFGAVARDLEHYQKAGESK